jgi:HSP20 family protein
VAKLDLAEVAHDDVEVLVDEGLLVIKGERKLLRDKDVRLLRSEIHYGPFERRFMLPDTVDAKAVKADFRNGVLFVHLPKLEKKLLKPKRIEIQ